MGIHECPCGGCEYDVEHWKKYGGAGFMSGGGMECCQQCDRDFCGECDPFSTTCEECGEGCKYCVEEVDFDECGCTKELCGSCADEHDQDECLKEKEEEEKTEKAARKAARKAKKVERKAARKAEKAAQKAARKAEKEKKKEDKKRAQEEKERVEKERQEEENNVKQDIESLSKTEMKSARGRLALLDLTNFLTKRPREISEEEQEDLANIKKLAMSNSSKTFISDKILPHLFLSSNHERPPSPAPVPPVPPVDEDDVQPHQLSQVGQKGAGQVLHVPL